MWDEPSGGDGWRRQRRSGAGGAARRGVTSETCKGFRSGKAGGVVTDQTTVTAAAFRAGGESHGAAMAAAAAMATVARRAAGTAAWRQRRSGDRAGQGDGSSDVAAAARLWRGWRVRAAGGGGGGVAAATRWRGLADGGLGRVFELCGCDVRAASLESAACGGLADGVALLLPPCVFRCVAMVLTHSHWRRVGEGWTVVCWFGASSLLFWRRGEQWDGSGTIAARRWRRRRRRRWRRYGALGAEVD